MKNKINNKYSDDLAARRLNNQLRRLRDMTLADGHTVEYQGKELINFSSNDYLGLARNPLLKQRAIEYVEKYGAGSTASRLICGSQPFFSEVEEKIAALKGTESALVMNSGFQANVSLIPALADRHSVILADRLAHNSIIQGALLSRARLLRFRHNDLGHLQELLAKYGGAEGRVLIVTESVFSMDGDVSDLDGLVDLARRYQALLFVDEAHATGVLGDCGMGLSCGKDIDLVMGTFGKGCGGYGAYVCSSAEMKQYLINYCSGFIYSTALPPSVIGTIMAALECVPKMAVERRHLMDLSNRLRVALNQLGFSTGGSSTHIIPVIIGGDQEALELTAFLEDRGVLAMAIRPPTVEPGQSRIRLALSCVHTKDQIEMLIDAFRIWKK